MTLALDWHLSRALLEWQTELGVTDAILAEPVDRFAAFEARQNARQNAPQNAPSDTRDAPRPARAPASGPVPGPTTGPSDPGPDPVAAAARLAARAPDLASLAESLEAFDLCALRRGARSCVFADGDPRARVMIVGEGPGADEDRQGLPFVGRAGQLLDRMFHAIGLSRRSPDAETALYITNTVPWRPPGNREPTPEELAMLRPFLVRHIELARPDVLVAMGNVACDALLGRRGILKLRGTWTEALGLPVLPMMHPAYLLRNPEAKREAWADLLSLKARLGAPR
ncbi:MAG: uracil-DNA glycosylase [Rhodobacter sp.]|uniref:uracil-DNA glycosylase n=1 Tax=Pararhodobacter sp. TaxID=2127056 RepID=UPI002CE5CDF0|nr:uracil-DNA glycosylase [Pararhodobacter sp.]MCC0073024.1 uracil-DNA glycosylase [Rhodobacter sp.]HPD91959.1 uracil-DNA glycosylase [Pararhodobacter sp.]